MAFHVVIPARYESTRLARKALLEIGGKPMLQHTYERAVMSGAKSIVIAVDNEHVAKIATEFGATICWTRSEHQSGTERIAEVIQELQYMDHEIIVNVQCDEPLIPPAVIYQTAENLALHLDADIATLCERMHHREELLDPNIVKVVRNKNNYALYFSRAPIAWDRDGNIQQEFSPYALYYRHIGLYAYRVSAIKRYVTWPPCYLEKMEVLEQLRVLWNGGRILVTETSESVPPGIDTPEDLEKVRKVFKSS